MSVHLDEYLAYYVDQKSPGYAILVTGDWGTGKTFQVRKALPSEKAHYVSLFGLGSSDEVVSAIFTAMFPKRAWAKKLAGRVGDISGEIPGVGSLAISGLISGITSALIRTELSNEKPIILDDLERCSLTTQEILGIINLCIEHHRCRVIVIAHDGKLTEDFNNAKEKIFGQTLRVEPQLELAFAEFLSLLPTKAREDVWNYQNELLAVFRESGIRSLRILRHAIEDVARLQSVLTPSHRSHHTAMLELIRLFCALDIECRANKWTADDLRNRAEKVYGFEIRMSKEAGNNDSRPPKLFTANKKYSLVSLTSTLLQDDALIQTLIEGRFDAKIIQQSLDNSSYFLKPTSSPWQLVGYFDNLEDEVVQAAIERMDEQFQNREVIESGEMLHIFALRMLMASEGILREDTTDVAAQCKAYIDDLLMKGKLSAREQGEDWFYKLLDSAHGVRYWVKSEFRKEFEDVRNYLIQARVNVMQEALPGRIPELLKTVETDGQLFFRKMCFTQHGGMEFDDIPILASIDVATFVSSWFQSPKSEWYWIARTLGQRYEYAHRETNLKPEKHWILAVSDLLNAEANRLQGLQRLRLQRVIGHMQLSKYH